MGLSCPATWRALINPCGVPPDALARWTPVTAILCGKVFPASAFSSAAYSIRVAQEGLVTSHRTREYHPHAVLKQTDRGMVAASSGASLTNSPTATAWCPGVGPAEATSRKTVSGSPLRSEHPATRPQRRAGQWRRSPRREGDCPKSPGRSPPSTSHAVGRQARARPAATGRVCLQALRNRPRVESCGARVASAKAFKTGKVNRSNLANSGRWESPAPPPVSSR